MNPPVSGGLEPTMRMKLGTLVLTTALCAVFSGPAGARNPEPGRPEPRQPRGDNRQHPLGKEQQGRRQKAVEAKLMGQAGGRVHEVAPGQFVELAQERSDRIFVVLAEFGRKKGPLHNKIVQPDRTVDNTTIWQADYNRAHYEDMYFNKMAAYYQSQSSGRYGFSGAVTDWVKVPLDEATYDATDFSVWDLIADAISIWTADQIERGATLEEVSEYLATFDQWDRYDHDGDGDFDEPDGYIDHFQIVHAGEGEETGGGAQGADAIWSHRWYAFYDGIGYWGPDDNPLGGTEFDGTGLWVGDYTIQPENGGLGVFAHEYGHDLGLPDAYDTTGLADNSSGFWTIMSSGSYLGDGTVDLGSRPGDFNAWEKFQLGWLSYDVAFSGTNSTHRLGPAETTTKAGQGLFVVLPDKIVSIQLATPPQGTRAWWSDAGDNLDNSMTRDIAVPASAATLTAQLWWDIEQDWDYAYVSVSNNGGVTWTNLSSTVTTNTNPNGQNFGNGITGTSNGWVPVSFSLSAWAGQTVKVRFRYWTDGFVQGKGLLVDAIQVGSFFDGAESGVNGWTLSGFATTTGVVTRPYFNAYVAEFRQYRGYDTGLRTGPYSFTSIAKQNWVTHYPYQDGLLISYWDSSFADNDVALHPGGGLILPVDSHPTPLIRGDGKPWASRVQGYDSTFSIEPTDAITLAYANFATGVQYPATTHPSLPAARVFDDRNTYWFPATQYAGVNVPKTGTRVELVRYNTQDNFLELNVTRN